MYRGYMRRGFSYLILFLCVSSILNQFEAGGWMVIPVLIWFYAFFDQINTLSSTEEEQAQMKDEAIFHSWIKRLNPKFVVKNRRMIGGAFLILGSYLLMESVYDSVILLIPQKIQPVLQNMMDSAPKMLFGCVILYGGFRLLQENIHFESIFVKHADALTKNDENLIARTNVVYYMNKGETMKEEKDKEMEKEQPDGGRDFADILQEVSREQLLERAKKLLQDDIYQSIHIESAAAVEPVKVEPSKHLEKANEIEKAAEIERASMIDKVEVERCPHDF